MASLVRQWMDDPELYRQARVEARQRAPLLFPHLDDPDLMRRLAPDMLGNFVDAIGGVAPAVEPERRQRRPSLTTLIKQAKRAGLTITAIKPDGTLVIDGEPDDEPEDDWRDVVRQ